MGDTLDALQRLQSIESDLRSAREQIESKRRAAEGHCRRVATLERKIADLHDLIRRAQAEADRLELDRKSHEAHITKLREALNRSKTNKEYAAILTQLNTDKADAMKFEDQVLAALTKVDEHKKQEATLRASLEKDKARSAELEQAARAVEQKLAGQITHLESQRDEAARNVPIEALRLFERACERHEGEGMALIAKTHPKRAEYICTGCNMSITLETINALQSPKQDAVIACHSCSRVLYLETHAAHV